MRNQLLYQSRWRIVLMVLAVIVILKVPNLRVLSNHSLKTLISCVYGYIFQNIHTYIVNNIKVFALYLTKRYLKIRIDQHC